MGKYSPLANHLSQEKNKGIKRVARTFEEIEYIIKAQLPHHSEIKHRAWWANDKTHVQAKDGWLAGGYKVEAIDLEKEVVVFILQSIPTDTENLAIETMNLHSM